MNSEKIIFAFLILIVLISFASSTISLNINTKPSFSIGEQISFDYTILSDATQTISYVAFVNCPNAPNPLLEIKNANLAANVPLTESHIYLSNVKDDIPPQICTALIGIISPIELVENKSFSIVTNPSFDFNVNLCKDASCNSQSKIFINGDTIYFNYNSSVSNTLISTNLLFPDGTTEQITIPSSRIINQIGTYELHINASKENYKTIIKKIQFVVIKEEAKIGYTNLAEQKQKSNFFNYLFYLIGAGIILLISIVVFWIIKKRKKV